MLGIFQNINRMNSLFPAFNWYKHRMCEYFSVGSNSDLTGVMIVALSNCWLLLYFSDQKFNYWIPKEPDLKHKSNYFVFCNASNCTRA